MFQRSKGSIWISIKLGDLIESALKTVGITSERVERWLGVPCGCAARRDALNNLTNWANRVQSGKVENAEGYLEEIVREPIDRSKK